MFATGLTNEKIESKFRTKKNNKYLIHSEN